jgi:raffinose/stachyose/melibiose transport system permease protein
MATSLAPTPTPAPRRPGQRTASPATRLLGAVTYVLLSLITVSVLGPLLYGVLGGFRDNGQLFAAPIGWPDPWIPSNYTSVLTSGSFWRQLLNSTLIAVLTTLIAVSFAALAAFVIARIKFRGREMVYTAFTLGLLFPVAVAILPLFILLRDLNMLNSVAGVALPQAAFALPLSIVILRPFFQGIPAELEDAAVIDGCSTFGFFWRVLLPLSRPALATVGILALVQSWNAYLLPLIVLGETGSWTLPLGVANFASSYAVDTAKVLAFTILSMVPAVLFYAAGERQLVAGLTEGAVKE